MQHETAADQSNETLERAERTDDLLEYFDLAWEIFVRLEREGRLGISDLTPPMVNPTVKPQIAPPQDKLTESA
jgi:hypothetical protein